MHHTLLVGLPCHATDLLRHRPRLAGRRREEFLSAVPRTPDGGPGQLGTAIIFYLVFIAGIVFFAVKPALEVNSATRALAYGALFGFFTYATYDLTNHATMRDWPAIVTIVDLAWGTVLSATVAYLSYQVSSRIG